MIYVFDTGILIDIFHHYYASRFPSFWKQLNLYIEENRIISVREAYHEVSEGKDELASWAKKHKNFFQKASPKETEFVAKIFQHRHFQQSLSEKKRMKGGAFADPFIIAKAQSVSGTVVTREKFKENAAKIPNICRNFQIECTDLEGFLNKENWVF